MKGFTARWLVMFVAVGLVFAVPGCATRQQANVAAVPEQEAIPTEPQEESYSDVELPPEVSATDEVQARESEVKESECVPYTVQAGDSLWRIARRHAVSVGEIKECNTLSNPDKLRVGQVIMLPPNAHEVPVSEQPRKKAESVSAPVAVEPYTGETIDYVIKKGDTLGGIAKAHGTTTALIRGANGLTNDKIIAGRKLKIPAPKQETLSPVEPSSFTTTPDPAAPTTSESAPLMTPPAEPMPSTMVPAMPPVGGSAPAEAAPAPAIPEVPAEPIIQ